MLTPPGKGAWPKVYRVVSYHGGVVQSWKVKLKVTDSSSLEAAIKSRLPSSSSASSPKLLPFDECPRDKGTYILQIWSDKWRCYVDASKEGVEGAKLTVVECDGSRVSQVLTVTQ